MSTPTNSGRGKDLVREVFLELYPNNDYWFQIAWNALTGTPQSAKKEVLIERTLAASGVADPRAREKARTLAALCEAVMEQNPLVIEELAERIERSCQKHGQSKLATERLKNALRKVTKGKSSAEYVVWTSLQSVLGTERSYASASQVESDYVAKSRRFNLFIFERAVWINTATEQCRVDLEERICRLLILLILNRGRHLPTLMAYRKAWGLLNLDPRDDETYVVEHFLKPAMSILRAKLERLGTIDKTFDIPGKKRFAGYLCNGNFSFCVIVPESEESAFTFSSFE